MVSRIENFLKPDTTVHDDEEQRLGSTESTSVGKTLPTPATPGFSLASGAAVKLLLALRHLAAVDPDGEYWLEEIGALSGLSNRAIGVALVELRVLGWARTHSCNESETTFALLEPPAILSPRAAKHFAKKIARLSKRPEIAD